VGALGDPSPAVQHGAARTLGDLAPTLPAEEAGQALEALERLFRQYGEGCRRADAAWGWRSVGNALIAFGDAGNQRLEALRTSADDPWLAWYAYEVMHVPQYATAVATCTEEEAAETHARYAPPFPGRRRG
jgi:hypothetical protein